MTRYLNIKTVYGVETIDELSRNDFNSLKEFSQELKRLKSEYAMAGMPGYWSRRATNDWRNKG